MLSSSFFGVDKKVKVTDRVYLSFSAGGVCEGLPIEHSDAVFRQSFETDFGSCFNQYVRFFLTENPQLNESICMPSLVGWNGLNV